MSNAIPQIPMPTGGKLTRAGIGAGPFMDLIAAGDFGYNVIDHTFLGDAVPGEIDPATNGTSAAVGTGTGGRGLTLTTGTDDNGYAGIAQALAFSGDLGFLFECWLELPADITTMKFEAGVTDALADAGAVLVKATPTQTADDYGVFVFDTDDDTALAFHSAKATTVVATEGLDTLVASDLLYLAVRAPGIHANNSGGDNLQFFYRVGTTGHLRGMSTDGHGGGAAIEGASLLTPWIFAQARAGSASRILTVLKWRCIGPLV